MTFGRMLRRWLPAFAYSGLLGTLAIAKLADEAALAGLGSVAAIVELLAAIMVWIPATAALAGIAGIGLASVYGMTTLFSSSGTASASCGCMGVLAGDPSLSLRLAVGGLIALSGAVVLLGGRKHG